MAGKQGNYDSYNNMGSYYYNGFGVQKNYTKAFKYFTLALPGKNITVYYNLGLLYEYGHGIDQNYEKAYEYYSLAVLDDHESAQIHLTTLKNIKTQIKKILSQYTQIDRHEGISYLFFSNFLQYLNPKVTNLEDPLIKKWISKYLTKYFKQIKPDFEASIIQIWFDDLFGTD